MFVLFCGQWIFMCNGRHNIDDVYQILLNSSNITVKVDIKDPSTPPHGIIRIYSPSKVIYKNTKSIYISVKSVFQEKNLLTHVLDQVLFRQQHSSVTMLYRKDKLLPFVVLFGDISILSLFCEKPGRMF